MRIKSMASALGVAALVAVGGTALSTGPAAADPPGHVHYVKGSSVWLHGCHGYLNAYGVGKNYHVQAVIYNQANGGGPEGVECNAKLEMKRGKHGRWLDTPQNNPWVAANWPGDWAAGRFHKDPTGWWGRACIDAMVNGDSTSTHCGAGK